MKTRKVLALVGSALFAASACTGAASPSPSVAAPTGAATQPGTSPDDGSSPTASAPGTGGGEAASVRLQLQWTPQAQFAGYFAAEEQGYFAEENLTVDILDGGPTIVPQQVGSAPDGPEFTISWVPKVLEAREAGSDLVNIAQIFQRSGTLSVVWADSGITDPCGVEGKNVGAWGFGNEFEVTAGLLNNCGFVSGEDYTQVTQNFDMVAFLNREIDMAEAMIYNEYAQVLETVNPETGELYKPEDMVVFDWNDFRSAMLQDAIFARKAWLDDANNRDIAVRFVRASLKGWIYCRDNPDDCVQYTTDAGSQLGQGHQRWMMNEVNPLIWPSPLAIGVVDPVFWTQTVNIAKQAGIIKNDPTFDAYDPTIVAEALLTMTDMDLMGADFEKGTVEVTPGGN
ncbi:MAG TPA: ABC transporter substrate-binding protein [Vitreimonas sp.]|nr:ABC transporter substrate-binding protein [Vitreimonas sp.]